MADGDNITAQAADGTIHVFPAGTDPAVIDGAMKKYVMSTAPQYGAVRKYAAEQNLPLDVAERHLRSINPTSAYQEQQPTSIGGKVLQQVKGGLDTGADMLGGTIDLGKQMAATPGPVEAGNLFLKKGISDPANAEWQKAKQTTGWERLGHFLASVIPMVGPMAAQSGEQIGKRDFGGGLVSGLAAVEGGRKMAPSGPDMSPIARNALGVGPDMTAQAVKDWQAKASDVSETNRQSLLRSRAAHESTVADIEELNRMKREDAMKDYQSKSADVQQQNRQSLSRARQGESEFQSKVEAAKRANEKSKADFQQRQQLIQEATSHAKELADRLPQLRDQAKADAKAMYPEISGVADGKELATKLEGAVSENLRGAGKTPAVLDRVIKAVQPEDLLSQASVFKGAGKAGRTPPGAVGLDELPAAARQKVLESLAKEPERSGYNPQELGGSSGKPDFQTLHEHFSDLGAELSKDLAPDERSAITGARDVLRQEMRKMADADGKLPQFQAAQANWKQYERTFNKTWNDKEGLASPVAKALNAKDSVSGQILPEKLSSILSKDTDYKLAQQMLQRYKGAPNDTLQAMKEKLDMAKGLPGKIKEGEVPSRSFAPVSLKSPPNMPEVSQRALPDYQSVSLKAPPEPLDMPGLKAEALRKKAEMLGGFSGRGMFIDSAAVVHTLTTGNPLALSIPIGRRLLARAIKSGSRGSLIELTPEEVELVRSTQGYQPKNISSGKVFPSQKVAAKAGGIPKGNPTPFGGEPEMEMLRRNPSRGTSMEEDIKAAEDKTTAEGEAKRKAWEEKQKGKKQ